MVKKSPPEKAKLEETRVIAEPIDAEKQDEYKESPPENAEEKPKERKFLKGAEREKLAREEDLAKWKPKTHLGVMVRAGTIKSIDEIFEKGYKILEPQIVDLLLPNLKSELLLIGQAKGKFGGGKRRFWRQTQKKTAEGNVPHFACMVVVGDENGHIGIGLGKAKETLPAKAKAHRAARLNLTLIRRGCGSFDCSCSDKHSVPLKIEGKRGSSRIVLTPAPKGTGLVAEKGVRTVLRLAGLKDVYTKTFGQSRTKINHAGATFNALKATLAVKM